MKTSYKEGGNNIQTTTSMSLDPISGVISSGLNFLNSHLQRKQSQKNLANQQRFEREQADLQWQRAIEQRDYMNQYNSPSMQMKRFKEAGLNPHLIYGKGGSPGQQTQQPQYQKPSVDFSQVKPYQVPDVISNYQSIALNTAQLNNLNKDIDVKESLRKKNIAEGKAALAREGLDTYELGFRQKQEEDKLKMTTAQRKKLEYERDSAQQMVRKNTAQADYAEIERDIKRTLQEAEELGLQPGIWGGAWLWQAMKSISKDLSENERLQYLMDKLSEGFSIWQSSGFAGLLKVMSGGTL